MNLDRPRHSRLGQFLSVARGILTRRLRPIFVDYPITPRPRYGWGKPVHPEMAAVIEAGRDRYARLLGSFAALHADLRVIPVDTNDPTTPAWRNDWFVGLDPLALYSIVRLQRPGLFIEVGSGHSTRFTRRAIQDGNLGTRLVSIDPRPRAQIDALCDEVIRSPLEDVDLAIFERLGSGDVLFLDGSHRVFTNSDVVVAFLEVLPRLSSGVLVHIHDVWWPSDYPPAWNQSYYSEQYLLATLLLGAPSRYEVVLPNAFVGTDSHLADLATQAFAGDVPAGWTAGGGSFWIRINDSPTGVPNKQSVDLQEPPIDRVGQTGLEPR